MGLTHSVGSRLKSPVEGNLPRPCRSARLPGITAPPNELNWDSVVLETGGTGTEITEVAGPAEQLRGSGLGLEY